MSGPYYKTNELARLLGISKNTLLRWEEEGLIPSAMRDGRGWRVWTKECFDKILELKRSKELKKDINVFSDHKLKVYIIGYGNQASVWAKNLKDSGAKVYILLRNKSSSASKAIDDGFEVFNIELGLKEAPSSSIFCLLIPDEEHKKFFEQYEPLIKKDFVFIFAHGFSVAYDNIKTKAKKILLAPKAVAKQLRLKYLDSKTVPAVYCVDNDKDFKIVKELATAVGFAPLIKASFIQETMSDLLTEQAIMCGGVPALIIKTFEILKDNGIPEDIAVQECLFELSYILDLVKEKGIAGMYKAISPVASSGGYKIFKHIDKGASVNEVLESSFKDIRNKKFLKYFNQTKKQDVLNYINKKAKNFDTALKKEH